MAHDLSWSSIGHGLLVLAALWWGWAAYAWLTNYVAGEDGPARLVVFVAMAAMVLVALAVPEAFDAHALLFALAYLVMRLAHLGLFWVSSRDVPEVHVAVATLLPTAITGPLLLVIAAFTDGGVQVGPVDHRARARLRRPAGARRRRVPHAPGALRRALLADRDHRARRVDRRDRRRSRRRAARPGDRRRGGAGADHLGGAVVGVLRRRGAGLPAPAARSCTAWPATRWGATRSPTCTCR